MNPQIILSLICDLYAQIAAREQRIEELQNALAAAEVKISDFEEN